MAGRRSSICRFLPSPAAPQGEQGWNERVARKAFAANYGVQFHIHAHQAIFVSNA